MRVTFRTMDEGLRSINTASEQFLMAQRQVETGKRVLAPSDDPAATQRIIDGKTEMGTLDAYTRASDTAASRLSVVDSVLSDIVDKITEARVSAATAIGTTTSPASRDALSLKITGLREALSSDLNSTFRGTFLFSGGNAHTPAYAQVAGVWTYQGDTSPITADIGRNRGVTIAMDGSAIAKGTDPKDILTELDDLAAAVQADNQPAIAAGMDALTRCFDRAIRAQSQVGVDEQGIDEERARLSSFRLATETNVSKDQNANMAEAISEMTQAQTAYQAALQAVANASRVSLLDYIR